MNDRRLRRRITRAAVVTAFVALPFVTCFLLARSQMTEREAEGRVSSYNGIVDRVRLKRVLVADRDTLARYVRGGDTALAGYAIGETARRRDSFLTPVLVARLSDPRNEQPSVAAANTLGDALWSEAARAGLRRFGLRDRRGPVRLASGLALGKHGDRAAIPALREGLEQRERTEWRRPGDPRASDPRLLAADLLSRFGDRKAAPFVRRLAQQKTGLNRMRLGPALGHFGDAASRQLLRKMLAHETYSGTRAHAALALGVAANRADVPALIRALRDRSPDVRYAAACSLGALGDRAALTALEQAVREPSPNAANARQMDAAARNAARQAADAIRAGRRVPPPPDLSSWRYQ